MGFKPRTHRYHCLFAAYSSYSLSKYITLQSSNHVQVIILIDNYVRVHHIVTGPTLNDLQLRVYPNAQDSHKSITPSMQQIYKATLRKRASTAEFIGLYQWSANVNHAIRIVVLTLFHLGQFAASDFSSAISSAKLSSRMPVRRSML